MDVQLVAPLGIVQVAIALIPVVPTQTARPSEPGAPVTVTVRGVVHFPRGIGQSLAVPPTLGPTLTSHVFVFTGGAPETGKAEYPATANHRKAISTASTVTLVIRRTSGLTICGIIGA